MSALDHRWSRALYTTAATHTWVRSAAIFCAVWLVWFPVGFLVIGLLRWGSEVVLAASLVLGFGINYLLGRWKPRARPYQTHTYTAHISTRWLGGSFPSDHAMLAAVCTGLLYVDGLYSFATCFTVATCVALGRVFVGVHYLSDVVAGALVGVGAVALVRVAMLLT